MFARIIHALIRKGVLLLTAVCLAMPAASSSNAASSFQLCSPDGKNAIELAGIGGGSNGLTIRITRGGRLAIEILSFTVNLSEGKGLSETATLDDIKRSKVNEQFALPWGKTKDVVNCGEFAALTLTDPQGIQWHIDLAAYDDGVAYRYRLPGQDKLTQFSLTNEAGLVRFAGTPTFHYTAWDSFSNDHEAVFQRGALRDIQKPLVDLPLLAVWPDGLAAGLTEAGIRNFPNLYLEKKAGSKLDAFHLRLTPLPNQNGMCVTGRTPHASPWRVVLLGEEAGRFLESNLLLCLNEPPSGDFAWVKPGKSTWHWWNGTFDQGPALTPGMNLKTHKRYIDFCAQNGIAYHAVVADARPWHIQPSDGFSPTNETDILTARPELELPAILKYAQQRSIGIRLWLHWKALTPKLEAAFQQYEDWGISGLMIDFLDRSDQEVVNFCERALESAARHKLTLQFHGSYKPGGEQRTYPHLFNREGVLNLEYLKWSKQCTPPHNIEAAYVRQLAGPLDYHTGGFRSISNNAFIPRNENPFVLGTRCHNLAMYVVYENPMPMVADTPEAYEGQTGFDFIVKVPTTWDESLFVAGEAGEFIVMARRNGAAWSLGGMTNWTPRNLSIPLRFLGPGQYNAQLYLDDSMDEEKPNAIRVESRTIGADTALPVAMAPGGGFTALITPQ